MGNTSLLGWDKIFLWYSDLTPWNWNDCTSLDVACFTLVFYFSTICKPPTSFAPNDLVFQIVPLLYDYNRGDVQNKSRIIYEVMEMKRFCPASAQTVSRSCAISRMLWSKWSPKLLFPSVSMDYKMSQKSVIYTALSTENFDRLIYFSS